MTEEQKDTFRRNDADIDEHGISFEELYTANDDLKKDFDTGNDTYAMAFKALHKPSCAVMDLS